jgi:rhamnulokinase
MFRVLAFDYGASSGRAILGSYDGTKLVLEEVHRFSNEPVEVNGTLYWDILGLFKEMKNGFLKCRAEHGHISGTGIDTWGVDFGILDRSGQLLSNPVHYRDSRTEGMIERACRKIPAEDIYKRTGIAFQKFNTLYQLLSMSEGGSSVLKQADKLLFIPDLLSYFLTGSKTTEFTIASTSQMLLAGTGTWDFDLIRSLGIRDDIFTEVIQPLTIAGEIRNSLGNELGIGKVPVVAVAEHDTGSAVVSVPATGGEHAYLSSGTWSLLGIESEKPVINEDTYRLNYTNEGGVNGSIRLLKNIMGLWIYQECKREWDRRGNKLGFDELEQKAGNAKPFASLIDPDDDMFYSPGGMPERIAEYCEKTGQPVPGDMFGMTRCIMESLALKYRMVLEGLEIITGKRLNALHIVGGGCKNKMLNQFTANSIKRPVYAGPVEATSTGNILCQLIALGELEGIAQARELVRNSFEIDEYVPQDTEAWDEAYDKFVKITGRRGC